MSRHRTLALTLAITLLAAAAFGSGWVGQGRVAYPRGDSADMQPVITVDRAGKPWAVWKMSSRTVTLYYSTWDGTCWAPRRAVSPNDSGVLDRLLPDMTFDSQNRAMLVWKNLHLDNTGSISSARWEETAWSSTIPVSRPDSVLMNFAPRVAHGGGQTWCVWFGGPTDTSPYAVYASHWNSEEGRWENKTRVSPLDGYHHWFCNVAVDTTGTPHVTWCTHPLYTVFYSFFGKGQWWGPFAVNDTHLVTASPWAQPRIVIDRDGVMHVSFTGAKVGAMRRDIFYTYNDGSGWAPCQMVTRDSLYNEWYASIVAVSRSDVWVAWDRQNEGSDAFRVYAAHFDGRKWSTEERLDNDIDYYDQGPILALGQEDVPWVIWQGRDSESGTYSIYFNRYVSSGVTEEAAPASPQTASARVCLLPGGCMLRCAFAEPGRIRAEVYCPTGSLVWSQVKPTQTDGTFTAFWDGRNTQGQTVPAGVYLYRLRGGGRNVTGKLVLLGNRQ